MPLELEERFLSHVLAFELEGEGPPLAQHLRAVGVDVPAPDELDDGALSSKLRDVIEALARLRIFLYSTDHLSDRELYLYVFEEMLPEPIVLARDPQSAWHFDLVGSGSEEDIALYLRYYADADERRQWARDFPDMTIPEPEVPRFDRDRHLPRPRR